jgi:hypothetical protein
MIPKRIHIVWNHKDVVNSTAPMITHGLRNLIDLNPDWELTVYTPEEVDRYLRDSTTAAEYDLIATRNHVSKTDLWRMIKMYNEGGLYMDIDRLVNIPLSDIVDDSVSWVCPTHDEYDFSNDFLLSSPGNPVFATTAKMYIHHVRQGWTHQYLLGPQIYMHACSLEICGEVIDINPGLEKFDMLRNLIAQHSWMRTYREIRHNDMIVYRGPLGDELETMKRSFYAQEGVRHWTGEW